MSRFTVNQHDSFVRASSRRKHLNALIVDKCQEYSSQSLETQGKSWPSIQQAQLQQQEWAAAADSAAPAEWRALDSLAHHDSMQRHSASATAQQQGKQPSWLMPWQTGDRTAGRQVALAVKAKRTPIGGFAQHSLAKAPK